MLKRTANCGDIREEHSGNKVIINGWLHKKRNLGGLVFADIRDRSGIVQVVFDPNVIDKNVFDNIQSVKLESVVAIQGTVRRRLSENANLATGKVEIVAETFELLSPADDLPFNPFSGQDVDENVRLKYRYLDMRNPSVRNILELRAKITQAVRNFLIENGFIEVETPYLTKSTPEGARDFLVPSRVNRGRFYALPQSPQLFKQILMIGGFERYFQIARCFRDEDLRIDRQPEFTQIDIEMSFIEQEDIINIIEEMYVKLFKQILNVEIKSPFPRITYEEAKLRFGSDKPDLRFGMEIKDITKQFENSQVQIIKNAVEKGEKLLALFLPGGANLSRSEVDSLKEEVKSIGLGGFIDVKIVNGELKSSFVKLMTEEEKQSLLSLGKDDELAMLFIGDKKHCYDLVGRARLMLANKFMLIPKNMLNFLWVVDFPFFSYNEEEKRYEAEHHPFTMPKTEDLDKLETDKDNVHAIAYDLVLNGSELGGGSIRIHNPEIQKRVFSAIGLSDDESEARFGFLLKALKLGAPPHGGIAFGLDRLVWIMSNANSLRDVIAFPKTTSGICPLTDAPSTVYSKQLDELGIKVVKNGQDA
ncbi:MAG: aspartate--tRNA ligase [Caldisericaceae bacterium]